jgi:hypothetical protein
MRLSIKAGTPEVNAPAKWRRSLQSQLISHFDRFVAGRQRTHWGGLATIRFEGRLDLRDSGIRVLMFAAVVGEPFASASH